MRVSEGREGREAKTAGHFAGLFHTSEFAPGYGDPLSDTPQCDDPATLLQACPDFGNAMFPGGLSTPGTLSPLQVRVVQLATSLSAHACEPAGRDLRGLRSAAALSA